MSQNDTRGNAAPTVRAAPGGRGVSGLRINSFSAAVMLLLEYGLGIWVNLYAKIPASDHGKGTFAAFVRAALARNTAATVIGAVAFLAVAAAWLAGTRFAGDAAGGASFGMAIATGVALLSYVVILFVPGLTEGPGR
jgi:hypothetical protein